MTRPLIVSVLRLATYTVKANSGRGTPITNDTSLPLAPPRLMKRHQLDRVLMIGRLSNPTVVYSFGTASPSPPQSPLKWKKQQHVDGKSSPRRLYTDQ